MAMVALFAVTSAEAGSEGLAGTWVTSDGSVTLKIESSERLLYNGHPYRCQIDARAIYVMDENGIVTPYFYRTDGNRLELLYPEGSVVLFERASPSAKKRSPDRTDGAVNSPETQKPETERGQNRLLRGRYCSFSGSSGGGSSFSTTYWAWFDGAGRFRYGSGSYYSGGGDLYGNEGEDGRGTYEVRGDTIMLRYPDGSSDRAYVYNRGAGGAITEIKYGNSVYAAQLCE
jgi:hypothetical protein